MRDLIARFPVGILSLLAALFSLSCASIANETAQPSEPAPRNVILFIADGGGAAHFTMARQFARHTGQRQSLYLDAHQLGAVQTHSARERVTDSASSATAYAAGIKTYNGAIGVDTLRQPVTSIVEAAERAGLATGLVATSRITHATPASFSAHVTDRWMEDEIAAQQIEMGIDVLFGGGRRHFLPEDGGGNREDGRDLLAEAQELGYSIPLEDADVASIDRTPVLGLFASSHLPYAIDREEDEPNLAALTRKAIELLSTDEEGFFLMVEGSRIDHASHENDAAAAVREVLEYDAAFDVAVDFARRDGRTLVIAVSDHETGGLSLGRDLPPADDPEGGYTAPTLWRSLHGEALYAWHPQALADARASAVAIADVLESGQADVDAVLRDLGGVDDLTTDEREAISVARSRGSGLYLVVGEIMARRALIGWTTEGHTGSDVNLYAFGPGSDALRGNSDNAELGRYLFDVLDLEAAVISDRSTSSQ